MTVSSVSSLTPAMTDSVGANKLYSLTVTVPDSVLDIAPVSQAGKDPLVAATLEDVTTYNKLVWMQQNTDWSGYEAKFGEQMTENAKAQQVAGIAQFSQNIMFEASASGVPMISTTTNAPNGSALTPVLKVSSSPFRSGNATINVKTEADGSLTAFKNGQPWRAFTATSLVGIDPNLGAGDIAMQLLCAKRGKSTQFA